MDSSKHNLVTEGCSSSESGWTVYLGSPMQEDDNECSDNDNDNDHDQNTFANDGDAGVYDDEQDNSDDSMASDASSGPHHRYKPENGRPSDDGTTRLKHEKGNHFNHFSTATKSSKKEKKNDGNGTVKDTRLFANRKYSK